jgi:hypothetical protein
MHDKGGGIVTGSKATANKICICDADAEYVQAFSSYLMERMHDVSISSFTSEEAFLQCQEHFQIGILSRDFLSLLEFSGKDTVDEKLYLCDEDIASEYEHLPMVYKYQSMEIVEEMLGQLRKKKDVGSWGIHGEAPAAICGIYSPICHELQMPFALAMCQIYREKGSVLFIDLEDISIMRDMVRQPERKNLMDLLYMMAQPEGSRPDITEYISSFMGIDYIAPFHNPEEFNDVNSETWCRFFRFISALGYENIVILFGRTMQGFIDMLTCCSQLIVLNKPGDYYQMSQKHFLQYLEESHITTNVESVLLPMSAGNLVDGAYMLEELIQGNLGVFVRKQVKKSQMAQGA